MKGKFRFAWTFAFLIAPVAAILVLASEPEPELRFENTSFFEQTRLSGRLTQMRTVNYRFTRVCVDYPNYGVLDEMFDVTSLSGCDGTQAEVCVKAYSLDGEKKGKLLYTFTDKADFGQITRFPGLSEDFYVTTTDGVGGAEDTHGLFRLDNGENLLHYSGDVAVLELTNLRWCRIAAYHSASATNTPEEVRGKASGIFYWASPTSVLTRIMFWVEGVPDWTPWIRFIDSSTGKEVSSRALLANAGKQKDSLKKIALSLDFDDSEPVLIPLLNGELDLQNIQCPDNISYKALP